MEPLIRRLWLGYGAKFMRYCGVSVFNVIFGQGLLYFFHSILEWPGWIANVAAVCISAVPAYLLSRHWVWGQRGPNSFSTEILPFWTMALLGLVLSTVAIAIVDQHTDKAWPVQLASLMSFGVVWVFKFFVLEKWMWRHASGQLPAPAAAPTGQ